MSKNINVKVSTEKLIKALTEALSEREKQMSDHEKAQKEYEAEKKKFDASLLALVGTKKLTLKDTTVWKSRYGHDTPTVTFVFAISEAAKFPEEPECISYHVKHEADEIRNAIRLLKMTDEQYVSTSTYKGVAQYI